MKRKIQLAACILTTCLFASACGKDTSGTNKNMGSTDDVQETEAQELTEQDKVWHALLENLYVQGEVEIPTAEDSTTFMGKVEEELNQKPDWKNNVYYEQSDGTSLMYNVYDDFVSYTIRSNPYNEEPPYFNYDYTLVGFDGAGKMTELRTRIKTFNDGKRYTSDALGGFCDFIDKYKVTQEAELLQVLGIWDENIEHAFQSETAEDYVENFDTCYGKVRMAVRTKMMSQEHERFETTVALSFAADSASPFQTIYVSGESGITKGYESGITIDAYVMTDEYRAYGGTESKEASAEDVEEVWKFLADMKNMNFASCNPAGKTWQEFKEMLESVHNVTLEEEQYIPVDENWKIMFREEFMGRNVMTGEAMPAGTEISISNDYFTLLAEFDYDSDLFTGYIIRTENPYYFALLNEDDVNEMGDFLGFCSKYMITDEKDVLTTLGVESDLDEGNTTAQTPYGEADLRITKDEVGDYAGGNRRISELGELNLQMEIEAAGGMTEAGTMLDGDYTDADLFELFGLNESVYLTEAEPMTMHDSSTVLITFPENGDSPIKRIQLLANNVTGLDGLKYGNWEISAYLNN